MANIRLREGGGLIMSVREELVSRWGGESGMSYFARIDHGLSSIKLIKSFTVKNNHSFYLITLDINSDMLTSQVYGSYQDPQHQQWTLWMSWLPC